MFLVISGNMTAQSCEGTDTLASRIRELRLARRLTQEELAYKAGLVVKTVQNAEAGRLTPRHTTRKAIAKVLGVSLDELEAAS